MQVSIVACLGETVTKLIKWMHRWLAIVNERFRETLSYTQLSSRTLRLNTDYSRYLSQGKIWWDSLVPSIDLLVFIYLSTPPPSLVVYWRHFFSQSTSVYIALGAHSSALMHYINSRFTYLLTYLERKMEGRPFQYYLPTFFELVMVVTPTTDL